MLTGWDGRRLPGSKHYIPENIEEVCDIIKNAPRNKDGILIVSTKHLITNYPTLNISDANNKKDGGIVISLEKLKDMKLIGPKLLYVEPGITYTDAITYLAQQNPPLELHQLVNTPKVSIIGSSSTASHGFSLPSDTNGGCVGSYIKKVYYLDGNGNKKMCDEPNKLSILRGTYGAVLVYAVEIQVRAQTWVRSTIVDVPTEDFNLVGSIPLEQYVNDQIEKSGLTLTVNTQPRCGGCGCYGPGCYCCCYEPGCCVMSHSFGVHTIEHVEVPDNTITCCGKTNTCKGMCTDWNESCSSMLLSGISKLIRAGCDGLLCINRFRCPGSSGPVIEPWSLNQTQTMKDDTEFFKIADAEVIVPINVLSKALNTISLYLSNKYPFYQYQIYTRYTKPSLNVQIYPQKEDETLWMWIGFRVLRGDAKDDIVELVEILKQEYNARVHGAKLGVPRLEISTPPDLIKLYREEGLERFTTLHMY